MNNTEVVLKIPSKLELNAYKYHIQQKYKRNDKKMVIIYTQQITASGKRIL